MSDQYYYLLNSKEHGPFSRSAIESLMTTGKLTGAFLRSRSDQPWQAPDELGLGPAPLPQQHMPASANDPASVVFRSQREIKAAKPAGMVAPLIGGLALTAIVGAGVWFTVKPGGMDRETTPAVTESGSRVAHEADAEAVEAADAAALAADCAAGDEAACRGQQANADASATADAAIASPAPTSHRVSQTDDPCSDLVDEIIGPSPMMNGCDGSWQIAALRIRSECKLMRRLASEDPRNGSVQSRAVRSLVEKKLDGLYRIGGEYQINMPSHCR